MAKREEIIASSIQHAIIASDRPTFFNSLSGYFYVNWLSFERVREDLFTELRETWKISGDDYRDSFTMGGKERALQSMGDMGKQDPERRTWNQLCCHIEQDTLALLSSLPPGTGIWLSRCLAISSIRSSRMTCSSRMWIT